MTFDTDISTRSLRCTLLVFALGGFSAASNCRAEDAPTFGNDVIPILSKAGCNAGGCHGNRAGRGGFKLSLWGENPWQDFDAIAVDLAGRRVNRAAPTQSLLLLKPTGQAPHEGGKRFDPSSREYDLLHRWIAAGLAAPSDQTPHPTTLGVSPPEAYLIDPKDRVQLKVMARFSDGSRRDVTSLAVYAPSSLAATVDGEGCVHRAQMGETTILVRYRQLQQPVRVAFLPGRQDFTWQDPQPANAVDSFIYAKLKRLRLNPSRPTTDHEFVRRVYLDVLGVAPTADEARDFAADRNPDKRSQLIDELLQRPQFAEHWALKWSDVLRNEEKVLDQTGVEKFHDWLCRSFAEAKPLDEFVRELLMAKGSTYDNPPANFWRALRDPTIRAEATARVFLGVRLQCARCHNHPTDRWTQDDYYNWAAAFAAIDYEIRENKRADKLDKNAFVGEQIVLMKGDSTLNNPRTDQPASPTLLGRKPLDAEPGEKALESLAKWMTRPDNDTFARAQANRLWYHMMGRGLVEPLDDLRVTNPGVNPELLEFLARDLATHGYDIRHTLRQILRSHTYQAAAEPNDSNGDDQTNFSRAIVRRLPAESLLDAQCQVLGMPAKFNGYTSGTRAGQIAGVHRVRLREKTPTGDDRFLTLFGKPERLMSSECERSSETTLSQSLVLVGGPGLNERLTATGNRLDELADSDLTARELLDELYWSALSRPPTEVERNRFEPLLSDGKQRIDALHDITWALLNAKEFLFRH